MQTVCACEQSCNSRRWKKNGCKGRAGDAVRLEHCAGKGPEAWHLGWSVAWKRNSCTIPKINTFEEKGHCLYPHYGTLSVIKEKESEPALK